MTIDNHLATYSAAGAWGVSVKPLLDILTVIEQWRKRRAGQQSRRRDAFDDLRDNVTDELRSTILLVFQNEYEALGRLDTQRFLVTTGIFSCIAVGFWHTELQVAALGHLKHTNDAETAINAILVKFTDKLRLAGGAWESQKIRGFLCGGRLGVNDTKSQAIIHALSERGISRQNLDLTNCLRNSDYPIQIAIDRKTPSSFVFTDTLKVGPWALRSQGARNIAISREQTDQFFQYAY